MSLTGVETSRGETGSVKVSDETLVAGWGVGTMTFSGTVPLLGVLPNDGNQRCYSYQIIQADGEHFGFGSSVIVEYFGRLVLLFQADRKITA